MPLKQTFDTFDTIFGSVTQADVDGVVNSAGFGRISSIFIDDSSTAFGFDYANFDLYFPE